MSARGGMTVLLAASALAIFSACLMGISIYLLILLVERLAMPWHSSFRE